MILLACSSLALAALLYVFWFRPEPVPVKSRAEREVDYLEEKRSVVYENLRDLHLEYRMGKLSDQDYQEMKGRYQVELAAILQALEQQRGAQPLASEPVPGECARCGKENPLSNRFCGACGAELPKSGLEG